MGWHEVVVKFQRDMSNTNPEFLDCIECDNEDNEANSFPKERIVHFIKEKDNFI